jgi:hypothetical protein
MKIGSRLIRLKISFLIFLFCLPVLLQAQSGANSGQILGQVLDPSSASVPGAEVTVRNKDTNFVRSSVTDDAGRYTVPLLPLGVYEVTARVQGFDAATQEAVVSLGSSITANFRLTVGGISETIQVTNDSIADRTLAASKFVLTDIQLRHMPSNGARVQNFVWNVPGGQIEPE